MTLIDVLVGTALILVIFMALFGLLRASIDVVQLTKAKAIATTIAESQMEYVRSLSYDQVGTVGGIPAGVIPQYATTTSNGIGYGVRTFIDYADDPADGIGAADTNGIITDYKRIKITVAYTAGGQPRSVVMLSNYSPAGLETTTGGGTLKLVIVNASGVAVPGASVHIVNSAASPSIDVTTFSDSTGIVYLPGAATSSQYQVYVTKAGYSSAQTYLRDATNQNPTPGYLTVSKDLTTTATFAIDLLSTLTFHTYTAIATTTFSDAFPNASKLASQSNTQVSGGALSLLNGGSSGYALSGNAISSTITPTYLASWTSASSTQSVPNGTSAVFHIVDGSGTLLPDAALPGNSAGFGAPIDLSGISTTTYPSLALRADLSTNATSTTPLIQNWGLSYMRGPIPLPNVPFTLAGAKTVGSTGAGAPIYKTTISTSTDSTGTNALSLEWDAYTFGLSSYDTVDACNAPPYAVSPGTTGDTALYLAAPTSNSVLVSVRDSTGTAVPGASVTLSRSGYSSTVMTSGCGGAYFGGITASSAYTITVSKAGYTTDTAANVDLSGHIFYADSL
ncbi:MAG: Autotransporter adhesin [Parcubacteria group bacterium]|nr:Autotransporter adhesin [Parcubacteria group bacterium]